MSFKTICKNIRTFINNESIDKINEKFCDVIIKSNIQ